MRRVVHDPYHVPWTPAPTSRVVGRKYKPFLEGLSLLSPDSGVPEASLNCVVIKQGEELRWKNTFVGVDVYALEIPRMLS